MPPFMRKTLVLVGSHGVGRRTIKARVLASDEEKFGAVIPRGCRILMPGRHLLSFDRDSRIKVSLTPTQNL